MTIMEGLCKICFLNRHNTKNNTFKLHKHNCYEAVFFISGSGKTLIEGREYPISENSFCIIAPNSEHIECINGYGEIMFIGFEYKGNEPLNEGVYFGGGEKMISPFNKIFDEYTHQKIGFEIAAKSLLNLFLLEILRENREENSDCKDLNYIKTYIEQHFEQKINFSELSQMSGYSSDYFRHVFKQKFGLSPQAYMINIRLEKARRMIEEKNLSCTEIAYKCGFSNAAQFSQMFKNKFGVSPNSYK